MANGNGNIVQRRPAETVGTIGATATAILLAFGVDATFAAGVGMAAGYAPAIITWIVTLVRK